MKKTIAKMNFSFFSIMLVVSLAFPLEVFAQRNMRGGDGVRFVSAERPVLEKGRFQRSFKEGEVIVRYKKNKIDLKKEEGRKKALAVELAQDLEELDKIEDLNIRVLKTRKNESVEEAVDRLRSDPGVEFAEPNYVKDPFAVPNDVNFFKQWGFHNTGQTINVSGQDYIGLNDADIDAPEAWDIESDSNVEVVVAVIDTGVRHTHLDLSSNMWDGSSFCKDENNIEIPGGCPNHGWNFKEDNNNPDDVEFLYDDGEGADDISGHGTLIAGVIAGVSDNSIGISGTSKKNKIKVMAIRFGFDTVTEVKAINFAKNNGADVINASFGGSYSESEKTALESFGGIVVAAAGNDGQNIEENLHYPCAYNSGNVICTNSTQQEDMLSDFSNYGSLSVDLSAPGERILSLYNQSDSSYAYAGGTSIAAAFVSGAAAFLASADPLLPVSETKSALLSWGDSLPSLLGKTVSGRRLNLYGSLSFVLGDGSESEEEPAQEQESSQDETPAVLSSEPSLSVRSQKKEKRKFSDWFKAKERIRLSGVAVDLPSGKVVIKGKEGKILKEAFIDSKGAWKARLKLKKTTTASFVYYDRNGFEIASRSKKIKIDGEKPKIKNLPAVLTKNRGEEVSWKVSDNKGVSRHKYSIDGKKYTSKKSKFNVPSDLPSGLHNVQIKSYDKAGNRATANFLLWVR